MTKITPIIAVKNVTQSSKWYQDVFGFRSRHGGDEFEMLHDPADQLILCLHKWEVHHHPSMSDNSVGVGNGLILYLSTSRLDAIREKLALMNYQVDSEIALSPVSHRREFALRDPDGYHILVTE